MSSRLKDALIKFQGFEFTDLRELTSFIQKNEIHFSSSDPASWICFLSFLESRLKGECGMYYAPEWLAEVFIQLAKANSSQVLCDPWAGIGFLVGLLGEACQAKEVFAFTQSQAEQALGSVLVPKSHWQLGEPLNLLDSAVDCEYDLVASILPMGVRARNPLNVTTLSGESVALHDDLGHLVMVSASMRLGTTGVGLFVVTPSFFFSRHSVFRQFETLGLGVEAALALPSGTFAPVTHIPAYLIIVRRKKVRSMFVAQLSSDAKANQQVIKNFQESQEGGSLELGRFVDPQSFRSLQAIRTAENLASAERRFGLPAILLEDLATAITLGRFGDDFAFPQVENSVLIPLVGNTNVVESLTQITLKQQNYAQVAIDPKRSNARFVANFLNSDFGKELREQCKVGAVIPKLNKQALNNIRIFVPDLRTQRTMLEMEARIAAEENTLSSLHNELRECRRELWGNPRTAPSVKQRLSVLSERLGGSIKEHTAERLDQWFETLPFPLASILRAWQATPSQDFKTKHEHLLHLFEGTAEFFGVILLSAFSSNESLFAPRRQKLREAMEKQNLSFQRATFGTWKLVVEYLGKQTRELLAEGGKKPEDAKNDRAICADML